MADLQRYAKSVSDALVKIGSTITGTIGYLVDHKEAIAALAAAYATFKAGSFLSQLDLVNKAGTALTGNFTTLTGATKGVGAAMLALAAVDVGQRLFELHEGAARGNAGVVKTLRSGGAGREKICTCNDPAVSAQVTPLI